MPFCPTSIEPLESRIAPATFTVTTFADAGAGSLRQAILDANATTDADIVAFDIPGAGVRTIALAAPLPAIVQPLFIDGTTQSGFTAGQPPMIELNGSGVGPAAIGIEVLAADTRITALTIGGFNGAGIVLGGTGGRVEGSYIGTDAAGQNTAPNGVGIRITGAQSSIGGTGVGFSNLIGGNTGAGILLTGASATGSVIQGNVIGMRADFSAPLPNATGITVASGATDNLIGGNGPGTPNLIGGNTGAGIVIVNPAQSPANALLGNLIADNGGLGIDLFNDGVTTNSPSGHQNFPVIAEALAGGGRTLLRGTLASIPSTAFRVQFFVSAAPDPSGFGEGREFLGETFTTTDTTGVATFAAALPLEAITGRFVTAIALDFAGNTSEFSAAQIVASGLRQPTIAPDGRSATFTDADGDRVTLVVSKGRLDPADFTLVAAGSGNGAQLLALNLSDDGAEFSGSNLALTARRTAAGGDGFVNLGYLNATGVNLGVVRVVGDLGQIDAGAGSVLVPALRSLSAQSLGRFAGQTEPVGSVPVSTIVGSATAIGIAGDILGPRLDVTGNLASLTVGRSVIGFSAALPGLVVVSGTLGVARIGGDVAGAADASTGRIDAGAIRDISIGGSLIGGAGEDSGSVSAGVGGIAKLTVRGSLFGQGGASSGAIFTPGALGRISVGGSLIGGSGEASGSIDSAAGIATLRVGGYVLGGAGNFSASIISAGRIGSVAIAGSLLAPLASRLSIGSVSIGGDLFSVVSALGSANPTTAIEALAIGRITVRGDFSGSIFAGWDFVDGLWKNSDVAIGPIVIGGNAGTVRISAGVDPGANGSFADGDDRLVAGGNSAIQSQIASVLVRGQMGRSDLGEHFGITAQRIGRLQTGVTVFPLTLGTDRFDIGILGNTSLREV